MFLNRVSVFIKYGREDMATFAHWTIVCAIRFVFPQVPTDRLNLLERRITQRTLATVFPAALIM
jgi:hypothetical protein